VIVMVQEKYYLEHALVFGSVGQRSQQFLSAIESCMRKVVSQWWPRVHGWKRTKSIVSKRAPGHKAGNGNSGVILNGEPQGVTVPHYDVSATPLTVGGYSEGPASKKYEAFYL